MSTWDNTSEMGLIRFVTITGTHSSTGCVTEKSCNFAHDVCGFGGAQINGHNYWSRTDGWWGIPHRVGESRDAQYLNR